jgi:hypothetical protein
MSDSELRLYIAYAILASRTRIHQHDLTEYKSNNSGASKA